MLRFFAIGLLAISLLTVAQPSQAGTPKISVKTLVTGAQNQLQTWRGAEHRLAQTRATSTALAARIDHLKRSGRAGAQLQSQLRQSLNAEQQLRAALTQHADARNDVERTVRGGVARIDQEIRSLVPQLKAGPLADRKQAAGRINVLRKARQQLRDTLQALQGPQPAAQRAWAKYQVKVLPLDGPSELQDKADFVEDTRDKLAKKRLALAKLLNEAKQERQIARAAQDFDTYVRIFDEEARSGRITRQPGRGGAAEAAADTTVLQGAAEPTKTTGATAGTLDPGTNSGFESTPNPAPQAPPTDSTANNNGGTPTTPTTGGTANRDDGSRAQAPAAVAEPNAAPVVRELNADVLLNLRVAQLATETLDVATLKRLVAELEALDRFLDGQAKSIRRRAQTLESNEVGTDR